MSAQTARSHIVQFARRDRDAVDLSRELRSLGFRFVGPTIVYAFMQAVGMVNDHTVDCFRHSELKNLA